RNDLFVANLGFQCQRLGILLQRTDKADDFDAGMIRERVLGLREDTLEISPGHDAQRNLAVDPSEGQIIDHATARRNISALRGVHSYGEHVVSVPFEMRRKFKGKRSVATSVFAEAVPVDPDRRSRHHALKIRKDMAISRLRR